MRFNGTLIIGTLLLVSCSSSNEEPDAYGNFSAKEIIVSAQTSGVVITKTIQEGMKVNEGDMAFIIDTVQAHLKRLEIISQEKAIRAKRKNINAQIEVINEQRSTLLTEIDRFENLVKEGASPRKQLDDLRNQSSLLDRQKEQITTNFSLLDAELKVLKVKVEQVEDMLNRAKISVPSGGIILEVYAENGEVVAMGKPLFKIADLSMMEMKAYFSGNQLASLKLDDRVVIFTDDGQGGLNKHDGTIFWISSEAEFTPKVIQTREERVSLVYAVKIRVANDGTLRMKMPGEVKLPIQSLGK